MKLKATPYQLISASIKLLVKSKLNENETGKKKAAAA